MLRRVVRELTVISVETTLLMALAATLGLSRAEFARKSDVVQAVERSRKVERVGGGGDDAPPFSSKWPRDIPWLSRGQEDSTLVSARPGSGEDN